MGPSIGTGGGGLKTFQALEQSIEEALRVLPDVGKLARNELTRERIVVDRWLADGAAQPLGRAIALQDLLEELGREVAEAVPEGGCRRYLEAYVSRDRVSQEQAARTAGVSRWNASRRYRKQVVQLLTEEWASRSLQTRASSRVPA